jgi:hypothetical protein
MAQCICLGTKAGHLSHCPYSATSQLQKLESTKTEAQERKATPIFSGVLMYFPLALAAIARVSKAGNDQHNPGQPLHWAREKSTDHLDCAARHLIDAGPDGDVLDTDGLPHLGKAVWRGLAKLQLNEEARLGRIQS